MKYIKLFKNYELVLEKNIEKILYHGSPYIFDKFKNTNTFFSDTKEFAIDYSNQKSMDSGMDSDTNLYVCKVKVKLFDINIDEHFNLLKSKLPNTVKVYLNNFGIGNEVDKDELLGWMKGKYLETPLEDAVITPIGETFPDPNYKRDKYLVLFKDDKFSYCILESNLDRLKSKKLSNPSYLRNPSEIKIIECFKPLRDFLIDYIKKVENTTYISDDLLKKYEMEFDDIGSTWSSIKIDKKDSIKYEKILNKCFLDMKKTLVDNNKTTKFEITPHIVELKNTWRYFENDTVSKLIHENGFGGYVAKESNINTYLIYEPNKSVEIIDYQFPSGRSFNSIEDYKVFIDINNWIAKNIKNIKRIYVNKYDVYSLYKQGKSKEEILKKIDIA